MSALSKNQIAEIRNLNLEVILSSLGLTRDPNDKRQFKDNDSRISFNGFKWYDHPNEVGGGGAIDLVMHCKQCDFTQAVKYLAGIDLSNITVSRVNDGTVRSNNQQSFKPEPNIEHLNAVRHYLTNTRKIDSKMIEWCIKTGRVYADDVKNCCFNYGDGVELKGTSSKKWGRCYGKITKPFLIPARSAQLVVVESAIDALSFRQLFNGVAVASIAGATRYGLVNYLYEYAQKNKQTLVCGFDNDSAGDESAHGIRKKYNILQRVRPNLKDWNEDLKEKA